MTIGLAPFIKPELFGDGRGWLTINGNDWSEASANAIMAAIRKAVGKDIRIQFYPDLQHPTKELKQGKQLVFDQQNVNQYLSMPGKAGTIFLNNDFQSTNSSVDVGGDAVDGIVQSAGFRSIKGADTINVLSEHSLTLLGDGSDVASGNIFVEGGTLTFGAEKHSASQGGKARIVWLGNESSMHVQRVSGIYDLDSLTMEGNSSLENKGHLRIKGALKVTSGQVENAGSVVADELVWNGDGEFKNPGVLSVGSSRSNVDINNSNILKAGHLRVGANNLLTNSGTLLATSIDTTGGYRFTKDAKLAIGETAVEQFLIDHPDVAQALLEAGETLSPEATQAAYGLQALKSRKVMPRSFALRNAGSYLSNVTGGDIGVEAASLLVATAEGGMSVDADKTEGFGSRFGMGGSITGDNVVSSRNADNRTVEIPSQTIDNNASLTLLDSSYLTAGNTITVKAGSKLLVRNC